MNKLKTQKEIYELIYKTTMAELTKNFDSDRASRLSNKYAVKNARNAYLTQPTSIKS